MGSSAAESALCASQATAMVLQRGQRRGRPRGGSWWCGWCWTAPYLAELLWRPQRALLSPLTGAVYLCQLTADARNRPDDRAARWIRRRSSEQEARASTGEIDAEALKKTTLSTEPNTETLNFLNLNRNSACQLFDEMILACGKIFWS